MRIGRYHGRLATQSYGAVEYRRLNTIKLLLAHLHPNHFIVVRKNYRRLMTII